jgi:hypothetical protein
MLKVMYYYDALQEASLMNVAPLRIRRAVSHGRDEALETDGRESQGAPFQPAIFSSDATNSFGVLLRGY